MSEERGSGLFWFLVGMLIGGGLVFFLATKEGKRILAKLNLDNQEMEKIRNLLDSINIADRERGEVVSSNGQEYYQDIRPAESNKSEESGHLFGHRFFKKKKAS